MIPSTSLATLDHPAPGTDHSARRPGRAAARPGNFWHDADGDGLLGRPSDSNHNPPNPAVTLRLRVGPWPAEASSTGCRQRARPSGARAHPPRCGKQGPTMPRTRPVPREQPQCARRPHAEHSESRERPQKSHATAPDWSRPRGRHRSLLGAPNVTN